MTVRLWIWVIILVKLLVSSSQIKKKYLLIVSMSSIPERRAKPAEGCAIKMCSNSLNCLSNYLTAAVATEGTFSN